MIEANTLIGLANVLLQLKNLSINKKRGKIKISAKHLVFISTNAIEDLLAGNVDMLKGPRTEAIFHCENAIYNFAKKAYRPPFKRGKVFSKWEDTPVYREKPNNVSMVQRKMNKQLFLQELREKDPLINEYICTSINNNEGDFNYSEYLKINYIEDLCCGSGIIECYELRPIFLVALWIENLDEKPIKLRNYSGKLYYPNDGLEFREDFWGIGEEKEVCLPKLSLNKGESILIPELLYLGEIEESGTKEPFLQFHRNVEEILEFDIYINQKKVVVFGPSFSIETFKYNNERLSIHPFNYNIILRLSKHFMVGSCPYAFGQNDQNIFFIKEILTNTDIDELELSGIQRLFIAELKEERTNLTDISMLSRKEILSIKRNININKGEYILINLNGYQDYNKLRIMGFYYPKQQIKCPSIDDIYSKMKAIELFIADCSKKKRNYNCVEEI